MTIVFKNEFSQDALMRIYKIGFGEMVFESKVNAKSTTFDLSSLSTGLYSVTIQLKNDLITRKFVKE
jgi:hypothetical protein